MAWLEQDRAGGPYQLVFRLGTQRIKRSTRTQDEHETQEIALRVERRLRLVEQGDLTIPEASDPAAFLMGEVEQKPLSLREFPTLKTGWELVSYRRFPLSSAADDEAFEGPRLPLTRATKQPQSLSKERGPTQSRRSFGHICSSMV